MAERGLARGALIVVLLQPDYSDGSVSGSRLDRLWNADAWCAFRSAAECYAAVPRRRVNKFVVEDACPPRGKKGTNSAMPMGLTGNIVRVVPLLVFAACTVNPASRDVSYREGALTQVEQGRVTICHQPPDATQPKTMVVAAPAVSAHLHHGDVVGECASGCTASTCDDANACTMDTCLADGTCSHVAVDCDDGNPCTTDLCDPVQGCITTAAPITTSCDDGNACTALDRCVGVTCVGSAIAGCCQSNGDCNDQNACTIDTCENHKCVVSNVNCTVSDACIAGYCDPNTGSCGAVAITCDDGDPCTEDGCDSSLGCTHKGIPGCGQPCCATGQSADCENTGSGTRCHLGTSDGHQCIGSVARIPVESCNGVDDDCNGLVDDVPGLGTSCTSGAVNTEGVCRAEWTCLGAPGLGPNGLTCVQVVGPTPEICNGLDDNCNGAVDESPSDVGVPCCPTGNLADCTGTVSGTSCRVGTAACMSGSIACVGAVVRHAETCNGLDDDCNGVVDDAPGGCGSCPAGTFRCPSSGACVGACSSCAGAVIGCGASMQCVANCGACSGLPSSCQESGQCVAACASCIGLGHTCGGAAGTGNACVLNCFSCGGPTCS